MPHLQELSSSPSLRRSSSEEDRALRIRIKNRRKMYLDRHPSYFTSPDLELSDPLLYDRCIRRFQTPAEREADGKAKGYSGVLEADLYRSEAKLAAIRKSDIAHFPQESSSSQVGENSASTSYVKGGNEEVLPEEEDDVPKSKEEGLEKWKWEMTLRFLRGEDPDFEYGVVDEGEEVDEVEGREMEEKWFEDEEPEWVESSGAEDEGNGDVEKKEKKGTSGETGVQDF